MLKVGLAIILILTVGRTCAQDNFVLIQSDNRQPFYVRMGGQFYSSSQEGHLILAHLRDSVYGVAIGFSGSIAAEQYFNISIRQKDLDLMIRQDRAEGGWNLYDAESSVTLKPAAPDNEKGNNAFRPFGVKKEDAFSQMMAGIVHDTVVLYDSYAQSSPPPGVDSGTVIDKTTSIPADTLASAAVAQVAKDPIAGASAQGSSMDSAVVRPGAPVLAATGTTKPGAPVLTTTESPGKPAASADSAGGLSHLMAQLDSAVRVTQPVAPSDSTVVVAARSAASVDSAVVRTAGTAVSVDPAVGSGSRTGGEPAVASAPLFRSSAAASADTLASASNLYRAPARSADSLGGGLRRTGAVAKLSEKKSPHSVRQVYADHSGGKKADTIVVVIPVDSPAVAGSTEPGPTGPAPLYRPGAGLNASLAAGSAPGHQADTNKRGGRPAIKVENSDCHSYATDYDVDKLRVKLLDAAKEEDRIALARKSFKVKCFSTPQIKALSEVFIGDAAKFHFFETAYPYCSDSNFRDLIGLLGDPVYTNKFRAMTNQ